ncbi:cytochrome P450 [Actinomadura spongiicola]|uniref:Cytochrome P450 n=1 Tax=Actinomadura spongiicola TaxID=2303421 RepID=A0A372GMK3_9ACTN|nr:cytochrome P450 [Actinomadura spongiicola]RFS86618.1 cytochrome P450 [Actinomadura spongiicola]
MAEHGTPPTTTPDTAPDTTPPPTPAPTPAPASATTLPTERDHPFDPPPEFGPLRAKGPLTPLSFPDGHVGWLTTSYATARKVLSDNRFSARQELRHLPIELAVAKEAMTGPPPPGFFMHMDPPEHTRYRRKLASSFSVRRMREFERKIERALAEPLAAMERQGPPADLVTTLVGPVRSLVTTELFGVPAADVDSFQEHTSVILDADSPADKVGESTGHLAQYVMGLVTSLRAEPAEQEPASVLGGLVKDPELSDEELLGMALLFLSAPDTTANMLGLGAYALLYHHEQLAALLADPTLADGAVEELLRYLSIMNVGPFRAALEDVDVDGCPVRAGETVVVAVPAVNRDPDRFGSPDTLDVTRPPTGHLTFGHGMHQCLGQHMIRVTMKTSYTLLLGRFPGLRLAVPPDEVPLRSNEATHHVRNLPVTWDGIAR